MHTLFLSTLSLRRATCRNAHLETHQRDISIHALLAESDFHWAVNIQRPAAFLSTLSLRRATNGRMRDAENLTISIHALLAESDPSSTVIVILRKNFYPRSPCGERRQVKQTYRGGIIFLSTLSLRRATVVRTLKLTNAMLFLSTLSLRRATSQQPAGTTSTTYFYPRSPCGERQDAHNSTNANLHFYPRSPCGERRLPTALRTPHQNFYPRSPCGERQHRVGEFQGVHYISTHALLAESDHNQ